MICTLAYWLNESVLLSCVVMRFKIWCWKTNWSWMNQKLKYFCVDRQLGWRVSLSTAFWLASIHSILQCGANTRANFGCQSLFWSACLIGCQILLFFQSLCKVCSYLTQKKPQTAFLSPLICQSYTIVIVCLLACPKYRLNVYRQHRMQLLELPWKVKKLTSSCPFSENCIGCPLMTASTINCSLPHTCQFIETLLSPSLNFFIFTSLLALSDQHLDLSFMFPDPELSKQSGMVSRPSGMFLHASRMPCLEASGKVILFSFSKLLWRLTSFSVTKIF